MIVIHLICSNCGDVGDSRDGWCAPHTLRYRLEKGGWLCGVKGRGKPERYETGREDYCPRCAKKA